MLQVYDSNQLEQLLAFLVAKLKQPLRDPLATEYIALPHRGLARWVTLQLAHELGVCAQIDFPSPAALIWQLFRYARPELTHESAFDRDPLAWRIFADLQQRELIGPFKHLGHYWQRADDYERFQLAWRLADIFDQYLIYRPDWISQWERKKWPNYLPESQQWQAELWRALTADHLPHRVNLSAQFQQWLETTKNLPNEWPERLFIFAIPSLPPTQFALFEQLAKRCAVHLFVLNPSAHYWGLIRDSRTIAKRIAAQEETDYLETGNRLLAAWGKQSQTFHHGLAEANVHLVEGFLPPTGDDLLHCLQRDIFALQNRGDNAKLLPHEAAEQPPKTAIPLHDTSLQIHCCHSPLREVEVLHDHLLRWFADNPDLKASEIAVLTPKIDEYAPFLQAVFQSSPLKIPFAIADRPLADVGNAAAVLLRLLDLATGRFPANDVAELLAIPAVHRRFGLDEADLSRIQRWLRDTGIRWGIDAQQRQLTDLNEESAHTWQAGLQRLFLGYALPTADDGPPKLFHGHLPFDAVEGEGARLLGQFWLFINGLFELPSRLAAPRPLEDWGALFADLLREFLQDSPEDESAQVLRERFDTWRAWHSGAVSLDSVRAYLQRQLQQQAGLASFLSGGITCAAMVPLRNLPFRIVCLLGLNDDAIPRGAPPKDFDLITAFPRSGDRDRRSDDRYLFLECLLSARKLLYLSYSGRSIRDDSPRPPSVLVAELLDYLRLGFTRPPITAEIDSWVVTHPLQAFSPRYHQTLDPRLFSYATLPTPPQIAVADGPLTPPDPLLKRIDLDTLLYFWKNPTSAFLRERLGVRLREADGPLADAEPFALEDFRDLDVRRLVVEGRLRGFDAAPLVGALGWLPHGTPGQVLYEREAALVQQRLVKRLAAQTAVQPPLPVELHLGDFVISGWLKGLWRQGLQGYEVQNLSGKQLVAIWIRHLVLQAIDPREIGRHTQWFCLGSDLKAVKQGELQLLPLSSPHEAQDNLLNLLNFYWGGLSAPLPFFPKSSLAAATKLVEGAGRETAAKAALGQWLGGYNHNGESGEASYQLLWKSQKSAVSQGNFLETAEAVFGPLIRHLQPASTAPESSKKSSKKSRH